MKKFYHDQEGNAAIEFAILAVILSVLFVGIIDFGIIMKTQIQMTNAAEAGSLYALNNSNDTTGIQSAVQNATTLGGISVTISKYCECANGSKPACTASCSDGSVLAKYTSITAQKQINTILAYPGMQNPFTVTAIATMRGQ